MRIGYGRVSSTSQDLQLQREALLQAGCEKVFVETASGAIHDRPQLKAALEYAREGDTIVVWKLDRLARSLRQLINTVDELKDRKIGFVSLTETIDTTSHTGRFIFQMFAALSEFERELIRERTRAGLENARRNGRIGGRPLQATSQKIEMAKVMLSDGRLTVVEVAEELGISSSTLYRHLPGGRSAVAG